MQKAILILFLALLVFGIALSSPIIIADDDDDLEEDEEEEEDEGEVEIEVEKKNGKSKVKFKGKDESGVETELEIETEDNDSQIKVKLSNGRRADIKIMPFQAAEIAIERLRAQNFTVELVEAQERGRLRAIYNVETNKTGRFLGIFKLKMKLEGQIDPETGELIRVKKPWWAFLVAGEEGDEITGKKVTLCHVPPGDPSAAHTISVGFRAKPAHLAHGDYEGACTGDQGNQTEPPPAGNETENDTEAPMWFDNSTNSTINVTSVEHMVRWTDNVSLSGYIFSFDDGSGSFVNDTFMLMSGTEDWSNVTKEVNTSAEALTRWMVYANDTSNNFNMTDEFSYNATA
jgi:hypothetical protein